MLFFFILHTSVIAFYRPAFEGKLLCSIFSVFLLTDKYVPESSIFEGEPLCSICLVFLLTTKYVPELSKTHAPYLLPSLLLLISDYE
jgi:hypothetical protein